MALSRLSSLEQKNLASNQAFQLMLRNALFVTERALEVRKIFAGSTQTCFSSFQQAVFIKWVAQKLILDELLIDFRSYGDDLMKLAQPNSASV